MIYAAARTDKGWRVVLVVGDETRDLCGAVDQFVAAMQADILNRMRGYV